jgi:hypothetical protein
MKSFEMKDIQNAKDYALQGWQALHVHTLNSGHPLFRRYPEIGHLFDMNKARLIATAKELGVRVIKVEREGQTGQHIDLCGKPFEKAVIRASWHMDVCEEQTHEILQGQGWKLCLNCGNALDDVRVVW